MMSGELIVINPVRYALVGEEKKRLPIKYNPNSAEGYEVIRQVSYKDEVRRSVQNCSGSVSVLTSLSSGDHSYSMMLKS